MPQHHHVLAPGTRTVASSTISFPDAPGGALEVDVEPLLDMYLMVGSGYGLEPHWRHGMWQGPLAVEGEILSVDDPRMWGLIDNVARFTCRGQRRRRRGRLRPARVLLPRRLRPVRPEGRARRSLAIRS